MIPISRNENVHSRLSPEVIIIGGSVAGLQTAMLLAQGGAHVRVFDANEWTHAQPRTLIATAQLSPVLGFFPGEAVVNQVRTIELVSSDRTVKVPLPEADLIVERVTLLAMLAAKARAAGVEIRTGHKFLGFEPNRDGVKALIQDKSNKRVHEFSTRSLVGADGAFSQVASMAQMKPLARVPLLQAVVELPRGFDSSNVRVWFEPDETPYFYWLIPESESKAAIGLIADESTTAKKKLQRFLHTRGLKAAQIQAAWIPLYASAYQPWRQISGCDIYLVGDAAGHVKITTVGGLVTGLRGARAAADAILNNVPYAKTLRALNRELWLHELIRRALNRFRPGDYDQLLKAIDGSTVRLLGRHNRDELSAMALKLMFTQPRLVSFLPRLFGTSKFAPATPRPQPAQQSTP